jgi:hypothetical protein
MNSRKSRKLGQTNSRERSIYDIRDTQLRAAKNVAASRGNVSGILKIPPPPPRTSTMMDDDGR